MLLPVRYIGFLTRCALSKPKPELSIVNVVKAMATAAGRLTPELSSAIFGDGDDAVHMAYSAAPTSHAYNAHTLRFTLIVPEKELSQQARQTQSARNKALVAEAHNPTQPLYAFVCNVLRREVSTWDADSPFDICEAAHGVVRDRVREKPWDARADGKLDAAGMWQLNRHMFACACNPSGGSRIAPEVVLLPRSATQSSTPTAAVHTAPFPLRTAIAYGLVKRWIAVRQGAHCTIIAHTRVFLSSLEDITGLPLLHQRSPPSLEDHYMLAQNIICRIALAPLPQDSSTFLVTHVV